MEELILLPENRHILLLRNSRVWIPGHMHRVEPRPHTEVTDGDREKGSLPLLTCYEVIINHLASLFPHTHNGNTMTRLPKTVGK